MRLRYVLAAVVAVGLCTVGIGSAVGSKRPTFAGVLFANATGAKEVSTETGRKGAGDRDGRAGFTAVIDGGQLCWAIAAKNVDGTPSGAHIHRGRPNENGPVVVPLDPPANADPGASSGCTAIASTLAAALVKNPARYYFNLHSTPRFPGGAVRGQLSWKRR